MSRQASTIGMHRNSLELNKLTSLIIPENYLSSQTTFPVLPDHLAYNSTTKRILDRIQEQNAVDKTKMVPPALQETRLQSLPSDTKVTIPHLRDFLAKFFKNESLHPLPELNKAELGLLSSVLTRKYGKSVTLGFINQ